MQITSMKTRILSIALLCAGCVQHPQLSNYIFHLPAGTEINISYDKSPSLHEHSRINENILYADKELISYLAEAEEAFSLTDEFRTRDGLHAFSAIVRMSSDADKPEGRCGAGYEDYLLLIGIDGKTATLLDHILLQSCLSDISLVSGSGDHPKHAVNLLPAPYIAEFKSTAPPDFTIVLHKVKVSDSNRIVIE